MNTIKSTTNGLVLTTQNTLHSTLKSSIHHRQPSSLRTHASLFCPRGIFTLQLTSVTVVASPDIPAVSQRWWGSLCLFRWYNYASKYLMQPPPEWITWPLTHLNCSLPLKSPQLAPPTPYSGEFCKGIWKTSQVFSLSLLLDESWCAF